MHNKIIQKSRNNNINKKHLYVTFSVRLENEHIGNTDQYRVTREVPLPYQIDEAGDGSDDDDEHENYSGRWRRPSVRMANLSSDEERHGADHEA